MGWQRAGKYRWPNWAGKEKHGRLRRLGEHEGSAKWSAESVVESKRVGRKRQVDGKSQQEQAARRENRKRTKGSKGDMSDPKLAATARA